MSYNYQMALATSSSFSPSASLTTHNHNQHQWKYDVFLSFGDEDTRDNFISHLLAALSEKGVETFIDYQLRKGDEIDPALRQAIQESNVAVVVFSKDYASSSWCLDELVEIMECRETRGQIVIPAFYHMSPSDVKKQTGSFDEATDLKRKRNFEINQDKVPKWKAALTRAANLSGWDSNVIRPERKLIDQIVKDVLEKLNQASSTPTGLEHLVGINSHLEQIKDVLSIGSPDVRILGIWGMGGIGKTTIAEAIFSQVSCQFDGCCFLNNVREESGKSGMKKLLEDLISQALGDSHIIIYKLSIGPGLSLTRRLHRKQILVVLDDVDDYSRGGQCLPPRAFVWYPGVRIPEWFEYQGTGDSVRIPLPSNWLNDRFLGFALCLVVETNNIFTSDIVCYCRFGYLSRDSRDSTFALNPMVLNKTQGAFLRERTEHVVLLYDGRLYNMIAKHRPHLTQFSYDAVLLKFVLQHQEVKKCGAIPLYAKDEEYNSWPVRWPKREARVDKWTLSYRDFGVVDELELETK